MQRLFTLARIGVWPKAPVNCWQENLSVLAGGLSGSSCVRRWHATTSACPPKRTHMADPDSCADWHWPATLNASLVNCPDTFSCDSGRVTIWQQISDAFIGLKLIFTNYTLENFFRALIGSTTLEMRNNSTIINIITTLCDNIWPLCFICSCS